MMRFLLLLPILMGGMASAGPIDSGAAADILNPSDDLDFASMSGAQRENLIQQLAAASFQRRSEDAEVMSSKETRRDEIELGKK